MSQDGYEDWSGQRTRRKNSGGHRRQDDSYPGAQDQYGQQGGYAGEDPYAEAGPYDQPGQYGGSGPYEQPGQYGDPYGQTDPGSRGQPYQSGLPGYPGSDGYGGDEAYGADSYQGGYPEAGYDAPDGYGQQDYGQYPDGGGYANGDYYGSGGAGGYGSQGYAAEELPGSAYNGGGGYDNGAGYGGSDFRAARGGYAAGGQLPGWQPEDGETGRGRRAQRRGRAAYDQQDPVQERQPGRAGRGGQVGDSHDAFFSGFGDDDDTGGRKRRVPVGLIALAVIVVIIVGVGGVGYHYYHEYKVKHQSFSGPGFGTVDVIVPQGATGDSIASELVSLGVVGSVDSFASYVANKTGLQPGKFALRHHMGNAQAWAILTNPKDAIDSKVTIDPGLPISKILPELAKQSGIPLSKFKSAIKDTKALGLPSYANGNPEGFLYPNTYDIVPGTTTALQILQEAVKDFSSVASSIGLTGAAQKAGFTDPSSGRPLPLQVITEASLLEAEVNRSSYFPDVARVIDNRLNDDMPLQLDSTISFITGDYSFNLSSSQLHTPSPYNTFLHTGLPPGPIDSPDLTAINAVLHPAPHSDDWIYFETVNKAGKTEFTDSAATFQQLQAEAKRNGV
jgi:UPF0755 protein